MGNTNLVSGIFWSLIMRWSVKLIGLVNTVILARLLTPDDFGIVAMATLVIGLIEELSTVNVSLLLIRTKGNDRSHADTAWTIGLLQSLLVVILLFLLAPLAAIYFDDPRVIAVISILAISKIFMGLRNVGVILARKELNFYFDYKFMVFSRLITFCSVIILAYTRGDYWAIVYGALISECIIAILSFYMHPYRPKLCLVHAKEYISFALAMIPMAIAKLFNNKFDVMVVGGGAGTSLMGVYNLANEISALFTIELILPITRGLFPNFSKLVGDMPQFIKVYLQVLSGALSVCLPVGVGLYIIANDFVLLLLGEQWLESVVFIRWLIIYGTITCIMILMSEHPLIALGMEKMTNILMWIRLIVLIICVLIGQNLGQTEGVAMGMAAAAIINFPIVTFFVFRSLKLSLMDLLYNIWRPIVSVIPMAMTSIFLQHISVDNHFILLKLLIIIIPSVIVYTAVLMGLWWVSGQPEGLEEFVKRKLSKSGLKPG